MMVLFLKGYLALTNMVTIPIGAERIMATIQALGGVFSGGFLFLFIIIRGGIFLEKELSFFIWEQIMPVIIQEE